MPLALEVLIEEIGPWFPSDAVSSIGDVIAAWMSSLPVFLVTARLWLPTLRTLVHEKLFLSKDKEFWRLVEWSFSSDSETDLEKSFEHESVMCR